MISPFFSINDPADHPVRVIWDVDQQSGEIHAGHLETDVFSEKTALLQNRDQRLRIGLRVCN
ncbi:MAG: hypothetical protein OJF50_002752 [Nitrospira sp.]|jgi:hypothetical protein|nr:hypothetical protein [Nitrospira sp.]